MHCCVCDAAMQQRRAPWCYRCPVCRTWGSTLDVSINVGESPIAEDLREVGLRALREVNNTRILTTLRQLGVRPGATVLDVGSAHGWFVAAARRAGLHADGLEPDQEMAAASAAAGVPVTVGYFPNDLPAGARFDVLSFNDVLEHLPDPRKALEVCHDRLNPGGLVSLNLPTSQGLVYRVSAQLHRLGVAAVFERLWQVGLPSPHLWYFRADSLARLGREAGFELAYSGRLASVSRSGLWQRAHFDRKPSPVTAASVAVGYVAAPVLNSAWASDIMHLVFRRPADPCAA